jgi:hypothetical protein
MPLAPVRKASGLCIELVTNGVHSARIAVRIFVGVTHRPWFEFLSARRPEEVNFWQPSGSGVFRAMRPGELFLFKLKGGDGAISGSAYSGMHRSRRCRSPGTLSANRTVTPRRRDAPDDRRAQA